MEKELELIHNQKLQQAHEITSKLFDHLKLNDWTIDEGALNKIRTTDNEIEQMVSLVLHSLINLLENSYLNEALKWSENEMRDMRGNHIPVSQEDQEKAKKDAGQIYQTLYKLKELM